MARSFFTGTDVELLTGSAAFSTQINEHWESFGLPEQQCIDYALLNGEYAAAYQAANSPDLRTRGLVMRKNEAAEKLRVAASDLAKLINGNVNISSAQRIGLGLSVASAGSPLPAPGMPYSHDVRLLGDGSIELSWKCENPRRGAGVLYMISRKVGIGSEFEYIGRSGKRKFVDDTLPVGASQIQYQVQAVRSTAAGPIATFNVLFGVAPGSPRSQFTPRGQMAA